MRNGNSGVLLKAFEDYVCFYLTYEEWKQGITIDDDVVIKVFTLPMRNGNTFLLCMTLHWCFVFTLPMRNGNLYLSYISVYNFVCVFTLPMRNGNMTLNSRLRQRQGHVFTLPMRNGNL